MNKIIISALFLSAFAAPAFAANETGTFYGALDIGSLSYSNSGGGDANVGQDFPNPGAFRFAGGYRLTRHISIEAGYALIGDATLTNFGTTATLSTSSLHATAVGTYPVAGAVNVFGKLGMGLNSSKISGTGALAALSGSDSGISLVFGFGAEYLLNSQTTLRAQYESLGDTKISTDAVPSLGVPASSWKASSSLISFGAIYNF